MTDSDSFDTAPDDNEAFANLDESLDDEDSVRPGHGPEGERDLDTDLIVDTEELEEAGALLDDPERIALLDGGIDDPDGSGPPAFEDDDAGWDVDPLQRDAVRDWSEGDEVDADGDAVPSSRLLDLPEVDDDDDPSAGIDFDQIPDDAPGLDGDRD
jgi:hypothetical protein